VSDWPSRSDTTRTALLSAYATRSPWGESAASHGGPFSSSLDCNPPASVTYNPSNVLNRISNEIGIQNVEFLKVDQLCDTARRPRRLEEDGVTARGERLLAALEAEITNLSKLEHELARTRRLLQESATRLPARRQPRAGHDGASAERTA
jgi:hypothetical protein